MDECRYRLCGITVGAEDADGDVELLAIGEDVRRRDEAAQDVADVGAREEQLEGEARADGRDEGDDERLEDAHALVLQIEQEEDVERGDGDADGSEMPKRRLSAIAEPITSARIAGRDRDLAEQPEHPDDGRAVVIATGLGEIASRHDAELGGQSLKQDRHEVRDQDDAEQRVSEARSAGEVRRPVARIHVADGDEVARAREGENLPPRGALADGTLR
jgi:hypothetical protein